MKMKLSNFRMASGIGSVLVGLLLFLWVSPPVQADTSTHINQFDIVRATHSYSRWTTEGCEDEDDIDDGCYVRVDADNDLETALTTANSTDAEEAWKDVFAQKCDHLSNGDDYDELNEDFNDCWEDSDAQGSGEVTWPQVRTSNEYFEATGFCRAGDAQCSISLTICYNADECDGRSSTDDEFQEDDGRKAEFFDANEGCLFDVNNSEFTACVNRGLARVYRWVDSYSANSYGDLVDELEAQGVEIDNYSTSLTRVEDPAYFDPSPPADTPPATITAVAPSQVQGALSGGPVGEYIVVNFTRHLEAGPYTVICDPVHGCVRVVGESQFFQSRFGRLFVRITDATTLSCMGTRGYARGTGYRVDFDNPDLRACDYRMERANGTCPAKSTGAKAELLTMYNLGLLSGVISPGLASTLSSEVNQAAASAPGCLCSAGFRNADLLTSTSATDNPWEFGAATSNSYICIL